MSDERPEYELRALLTPGEYNTLRNAAFDAGLATANAAVKCVIEACTLRSALERIAGATGLDAVALAEAAEGRVARLRAVAEALCDDDVGLPVCVEGPPMAAQAMWTAARHYEHGCNLAARPSGRWLRVLHPVEFGDDRTFAPGVYETDALGVPRVRRDGLLYHFEDGDFEWVEHPAAPGSRRMTAAGFDRARHMLCDALDRLQSGDVTPRALEMAQHPREALWAEKDGRYELGKNEP